MGIFDFLRKRQTTPDKLLDASLTVMDRSGRPKQPSFNYHSAIRHYSSWIYAAATINAQAVAANPLRLYVRSKPGAKRLYDTRPVPKRRKAYLMGDAAVQPSRSVMRKAISGEFEEVSFDHPVLEVLRKANTVDDGFGLAVTRILFLELTGNAYLHPVFGPLGVPDELWTMPSQYVKVIPTEEGLIAGYRYGVESQVEIDFEQDEVIHFRRPNPKSMLYGMGKCEAAWGVIQQNSAIHDMDLSMFENMARPDYAVIVKSAGREQLDRFETKVREALQGTRKAGKFFAMSGDVTLQPLSFPTKDLSGRDEIVEEIAAVFGVPVSMLKASDPNLASAKAGYAQWREGTIAPICRLDEETLNAKLLPLFQIEDDAYLAYDNPVPADRQQDLVERQAAVAGGWMTPNEARVESGYDPYEDPAADKLYLGGQPLGGAPGMPGMPGAMGGMGGPSTMPLGGARTPQNPSAQQPPVELPDAPQPVQASATPSKRAPLGPDCVSENIAILLDEGYPREQAIAIAISMCEGKAETLALPEPTEAREAREKRYAAKAVAEYVEQIDRDSQDADSAQIDRLLAAVEKGYIREITDDEILQTAIDASVDGMDEGVKALLGSYGRSVQGAERRLEVQAKAYGIDAQAADAMADEIDAVLKRAGETILKSQGNT